MDKSFGYMLAKCFLIATTVAFQFILMLFMNDGVVPYLLSNASIIGGYLLDIYLLRYSHPKKKQNVIFVMIYNSIALVMSLSGILLSAIGSAEFEEVYRSLLYTIIPGISLAALILYLWLNIDILIAVDKIEILESEV